MVCSSCGVALQQEQETCATCGAGAPGRASIRTQARTPAQASTRTSIRTKARLVAEHGRSGGTQFELNEDIVRIGREPGFNHLVIDDPDVSRRHAILAVDARGEPYLQDCSGNGTYVNGIRIREARLKPDDHIRFGYNDNNSFRLELPQAAQKTRGGTASPEQPQPPPQAPAQQPLKTMVYQRAVRAPNTLVTDLSALQARTCRLQLVVDKYSVKEIPFCQGKIVLGCSAARSTFSIDHSSISEVHAEIALSSPSTATLRDLDSTNGTFVNGERVTTRELEEGDLIQLGACESMQLLFRSPRPRLRKLTEVELSQPVVKLGRNPANTIHLQHPTVSAFHAEIRRTDRGLELTDLHSSNGTFVNGERIQARLLKERDRISLGAVEFVFDGAQFERQADGTAVQLSAQNLCAEAKDRNTGKMIRLLDNISLSLEPCEFVGLLGPSGAGKSTLMDALNGSRPATQGHVMLNERSLYEHPEALRALIGHLPQDDILHRDLTIRETLYFAGRLRLPDDYTEQEIDARVEEVVQRMKLAERAGNLVSQLSGGQRKRVSLAIELLNKPSVLFLDEPTAGQDPRTEMKMMELFREIANSGSTVIINTHLLGSFSLLDKVAILVRGKLAFFGPSQEMLPYFECRRPQEIFDKLEERSPDEWAQKYAASPLCNQYSSTVGLAAQAEAETSAEVPVDAIEPSVIEPSAAETKSGKTSIGEISINQTTIGQIRPAKPPKRSALRQLSTLLSRQLALKQKGSGTAAALLLPPIAIACLIGAMPQVPANDPKSLFITVLVALWFGCSSCVREIVDEAAIFRRENQRDLKLSSYLGSKLIYLMGLSGLQSALFMSVMTLGGKQDSHFLASLGLMWLIGIQGGLIGLLISALAPNAQTALYVFPLAMIPQLLLAGVLIPTADLHPFFPSLEGSTVELQPLPRELETIGGMSGVLRNVISPMIVARWGLEAMADVYAHDDQPYRYPILNNITITFHPNDAAQARAYVESIVGKPVEAIPPPPPTQPAMPQYLAMLAGFTIVMVTAIALALKRRAQANAS